MSNGSFDVDFQTTSNIYSTPFTNIWGDSKQWSLSAANGLWLGSSGTDYTPMGIMQTPSGNSAGEGYGAYSYTARYEYANQPGGDYLLLWRADDTWLDSAKPGVLTEMDMLETWDNSATEQSTLHYYNTANDVNGQIFHSTSGLDLTKLHVYSMDWESGSLTFYIDGVKIYQVTGSSVPADTAHGGNNQVMGMGAETETSPVGMYVTEAQYTSTPDIAAQGGVTSVMAAQMARESGSGTGAAPPVVVPPVIGPLTSIAVSAPGTVVETSPGAGVSVAETITAPGATTLYEATFTSSNVAEGNWQAVAVNAAGTGSFEAAFAHTGDYLVVVNSTSNATVQGYSSAITITDTAAAPVLTSIAVSAPGTVMEASPGAGVSVAETITAPGATTLYEATFTSSNAAEGNWQAVAINAAGTGSFKAGFEHSGDYLVVVNSTSNATVQGYSSAVTITDAPVAPPAPVLTSIAVSAPGTVKETAAGAGVTVTETVTAPNATTLYEATFTAANVAEGNWQAVAVNAAGTGSFQAAFAHTGDYVVVVNSTTNATVKGSSSAITITDPVVTPPPVTPPVTPPAATPSFTIASITEVAGHLVVIGDKESGSAATIRETIDGNYLGVIEDHAPDGKFNFTLADTTKGSHTMLLSLDGSALSAKMSFVIAPAVVTPPPVVPPAPVKGLVISALTEDAGRLEMTGDKEIGKAATLRETMDGHYLGTLRDGMADGAFNMHIADVAVGAHVLYLTLDGSSTTATYDFTKLASGTIQHIVPASTSASSLIAVASHS
ncbi:family 16 glycosylhydrolase [Lichenicoccus roseus]|nr:family 16 glycosylhydrolase [Lichenicoccus roseus]